MKQRMGKIIICTFMTILLILSFHIAGVYALGTPAGTTITNEARVFGDNVTSVTDTTTTNVLPIVGGHWLGSDDVIGAIAGSDVTNTTYLTNLGNEDFTFTIRVTNFSRSGVATAGPWDWVIYTQANYTTPAINTTTSNGGANTFDIDIPDGANRLIEMVVTVDGMAGTGHEQWRLMTKTSDPKENSANYTGDGATGVFGGPIGEGWGDTIADALIAYDTLIDNTYWRVSTDAPVITIAKDILSIVTGDAAGPNNVAIPGATITFRMIVSNALGSGAATGLKVRDIIATNRLIYVGGSMTTNNTSGGPYTWNTNVALPVIQWSNASGAFNAGSRTIFTFQAIIK